MYRQKLYKSSLYCIARRFLKEERAVAAAEFALIFPLLMTLLMGTFDLGYGILAAQKTIRASQTTADLIARHRSVSTTEINEAVTAGMVALNPFDTSTYGVDIASVSFDENSNPVVLWRETRNMSANNAALESLQGIADEGEGMVVVTVQYIYEPTFVTAVVKDIPLQEVSYVRGRLTPTVPME